MRRAIVLVLSLGCGGCGGEQKPTTPTTSTHAEPVASAAPSSSQCADSSSSSPYQPQAAWSGRAANIPDPPALPTTPERVGDAYTVYGAIRALQAIDATKLLAQDVSIVGVIVDTNLPRAPKCILHHTGIASPPGCTSEIPTFTIADDKAANSPRIKVMGWASNFPNVYEAYLKDKARSTEQRTDEIWGGEIPRPLPAVGAKVKVTGHYAAIFGLASSGIVAEPRTGIMTVKHTETLEPATTPATFPQLGGH